MQVFHDKQELQIAISQAKLKGLKIGYVPTMGNLHAGHVELVKLAKQRSDLVVVSIFVNPLQFGANEDLDKYPRTLEEDKQKLISVNTDFLYCPSTEDMYPGGLSSQTLVSVPCLSDILCGASRPGHFTGVATVVCKLFNIVQPSTAIFGVKDFQQLAVIQQMVTDLCIPVEIIRAPIIRAEDGLALSSRNGYLSATERLIAPEIYKNLLYVKQAIVDGERNFAQLEAKAKQALVEVGMRLDYFCIRDSKTLSPGQCYHYDLVILVAAYLGNTRLIDNVTLTLLTNEV